MKKLIAFGDSLTRGYQSAGMFGLSVKETPYIDFLKPLLGEEWSLENKGINGELTEQMVARFQHDVIIHKPEVVIILGGTNDIGWQVPPKDIIANLRKMIEQALEAGITPLPCAIPSLIGFDELIAPRQEINAEIYRYCKEKGLSFIDLFTATADKHNRLDARYSSDGLHLNTDGYKLFAETIFQQALAIIIKENDCDVGAVF